MLILDIFHIDIYLSIYLVALLMFSCYRYFIIDMDRTTIEVFFYSRSE